MLCERCLPPWYINHIPIDRAPWSTANWRAGDRFRCPGCRGAVGWHIHGPTWRPFPSDRERGIDGQGTDEADTGEPGDDVDAECRPEDRAPSCAASADRRLPQTLDVFMDFDAESVDAMIGGSRSCAAKCCRRYLRRRKGTRQMQASHRE